MQNHGSKSGGNAAPKRGMRFGARYGRLSALIAIGAATFLHSGTSHAFKPQSHQAVALNAAAEIEQYFGPGGNNKLVFKINGQTLEVPIAAKEVFNAVRNQQNFFLAGALGPDAFPDPITGQWIAHENETGTLMSMASAASGRTIEDLKISEPFEKRHSVAQYRAIDFAMDMLKFFDAEYRTRCSSCAEEHEQIIAFIAGYFAHGVTDGFSHTWVNDLTGASWSFDKGSGIFGPLTEEVQHVAVETMVDHRAPKTVFQADGDAGGFGRIGIEVPIKFLDAFYSSTTALGNDVHYDISNDPIQFINYYRNLDMFRGGVVYLYLNAQADLLPAMRNWSRMGWLFDLAEAVKNNTVLNLLFDLIEIPDRVVHELLKYAPEGIDTVTKLATFGYAHCMPMNTIDVFGDQPYTNSVREALEFLGGMNDRIAAHAERARVARANFTQLSGCIGENFAKGNAAKYDPAAPDQNTDPCADIVRAGYQDEGNPNGLYRGNVRGNSKIDREFLMDLKAAFLGGDPDELFEGIPDAWKGDAPYHADKAFEAGNKHRSMLKNFERIFKYLGKPGTTITGLDETILPSDGDGATWKQKVQAICADARDDGFKNCIDIVTLPIASAARQLACFGDWATCAANAAEDCARDACESSCMIPGVDCGSLCNSGDRGGCINFCHDAFFYECVDLGPFGSACAYINPVGYACEGICDVFDSTVDCATMAYKETVCGVKETVCSLEGIADDLDLQGLGDEILSPVRKVCDTFDAVDAFIQCLKGDPSKSEDEQKSARHTCVVDACNEVITRAGSSLPSELSGFDCEGTYQKIEDAYEEIEDLADTAKELWEAAQEHPEQFVNVLFFQKDMAKDGAYRQAIIQTIGEKRAALASNPPPSTATPEEIQAWQDQIKVLDDINNIANGGAPSSSLDPARLVKALGTLMKQPWPEFYGPTARQIISDMGTDFENSFTPAYNSIQGTKLAPMMSQSDIEALFAQQGVPQNLLPWMTAASSNDYSQICKDTASRTSLYCDAIPSFDDPNCKGPECGDPSYSLPDSARHDWVPGRGVVAFNPYDATKPVQNVLTNFPLASSQEAYDKIYTKIFRIPRVLPGFFGFDDPTKPWTSPTATITPNTTQYTEGTASTDARGCNFNDINSPYFRTADLGVVGTSMLIDVYLPTPANVNWAGDLQISVSIPGANIYNQYLNNGNPVAFTGRTTGWNTLTYPIPDNIRNALLGDYAGAQIMLHANIATCSAPLTFDNLRFGGTLTQRQTFHIRPSQTYGVANGSVMGFDQLSDWTASTAIAAAPEFLQGTGALAVPGGGYNPITSRRMTIAEIGIPSASINVDVYVPGPQSNRSWYGDVQLFWKCDHFGQISMGPKPLTNGFEKEYNSLKFDVPAALRTFLQGAPATEGCVVTVALNSNPGGSFYLDNMGFIH